MAPELPESLREVAERAASVLAPESDLFEDMDSAGFGDALTQAVRSALTHPVQPARSALHLATDLVKIPLVAGARWFGREVQPPVEVDPKDRRFAAPAWSTNPAYYSVRLAYLSASQVRPGRRRVGPDGPGNRAEGADGAQPARRHAGPDQLPADQPGRAGSGRSTPPAAAWSRVPGTSSATSINNGGKPRQVDTSGFEVGVNLACTPAKVVYRNELMELLQYEPQTEQVHATPLLCSPPWINKYYVMDLAPDRSFIEWAVRQGRTVFAISYKNPSADMSGTTMDDYLLHGPQTALDVIAGDHRRRDDRHRRAVPGRRDDGDHRRLPDPAGRQPGRHAHPAEHDAGLRRAGCA